MPAVALVTLLVLVMLLRRHATATSIHAMQALAQSERASEQAAEAGAIRERMITLSIPPINAMRLEASARQMIPDLSHDQPVDFPMQPVDDFLQTLEKHSLLVAGFEQILLGAASSAAVTPIESLAHMLFGAMVPVHAEVFERAVAVAREAVSGAVGPQVLEQAATLVGEVTKGVVKEISTDVVKDISLEVGKAVFDAQALINGLHQVVQYHLPVGEALAQFLSSQTQMLDVGGEVMANLLHLPGLRDAIEHGAILSLMEHQGLSLQDAITHHVAQQIQHAPAIADHLQHLGGTMQDGLMSHLPIITIGVTFFMQKRLVDQGKTTTAIAVEQFVVKVGTRWAGAAAGAKGGLLIAHFFGPLAPIVPIVGAAAGAMAAGKAGDEYLRAQLNKAIEECNARRDALLTESTRAANTAILTISSEMSTVRETYLRALGHAPNVNDALSPKSRAAVTKLCRSAEKSVKRAQARVRHAEQVSRQASWQRGFARLPENFEADLSLARDSVKHAETSLPVARQPRFEAAVQLAAGLPSIIGPARQSRVYQAQWQEVFGLLGRDVARYQKRVSQWSQGCARSYSQALATLMPVVSQASASYQEVYTPLYHAWQDAKSEVDNRRGGMGH